MISINSSPAMSPSPSISHASTSTEPDSLPDRDTSFARPLPRTQSPVRREFRTQASNISHADSIAVGASASDFNANQPQQLTRNNSGLSSRSQRSHRSTRSHAPSTHLSFSRTTSGQKRYGRRPSNVSTLSPVATTANGGKTAAASHQRPATLVKRGGGSALADHTAPEHIANTSLARKGTLFGSEQMASTRKHTEKSWIVDDRPHHLRKPGSRDTLPSQIQKKTRQAKQNTLFHRFQEMGEGHSHDHRKKDGSTCCVAPALVVSDSPAASSSSPVKRRSSNQLDVPHSPSKSSKK